MQLRAPGDDPGVAVGEAPGVGDVVLVGAGDGVGLVPGVPITTGPEGPGVGVTGTGAVGAGPGS